MVKKKVLIVIMAVFTLFLICIPLVLNIPYIADIASCYFKGLRTADYKIAYISLIGGIIGVWMTVGTTIIVQDIFDRNNNKEKEKIIRDIISLYLSDEILKNHNAMTTCDSAMHNHVAKESTVLQLVKEKNYTDVRHFYSEFFVDNWTKYAKIILDTDFEAYTVLSKLYECYSVIATFRRFNINTNSDFERSGILEYEKRYEKFCKKYGNLLASEQ